MFGDSQNQRDNTENSLRDTLDVTSRDINQFDNSPASWHSRTTKYTKTSRLVTALYMVTDIMDKDEPIRAKLRTLGVEILSDTNLSKKNMLHGMIDRIDSLLSFMNIAKDMDMISSMNASILTKEFHELRASIAGYATEKTDWLSEYISMPTEKEKEKDSGEERMTVMSNMTYFKGHPISKGHSYIKDMKNDNGQSTRLGVQKAGTLLKALDSITDSKTSSNHSDIKSKRREEVFSIIKDKLKDSDGLTITDIKSNAYGVLRKCGSKTLQRELMSMVEDGLLKKEGSKRWSRYLLNS